MKLPMLKADKANHFIYGGVIWLVIFACLGTFLPRGYAGGFATTLTVFVGALKEGYDFFQNQKSKSPEHTVDEWDAFATALGGAFLWVAFAVIGGIHGEG